MIFYNNDEVDDVVISPQLKYYYAKNSNGFQARVSVGTKIRATCYGRSRGCKNHMLYEKGKECKPEVSPPPHFSR